MLLDTPVGVKNARGKQAWQLQTFLGQYDKKRHGHLEITRGNETCPEDAHDASRLNLSLAYEVRAEPEALDKHGHCDELRFPCGSVPYDGKCSECSRDTCKE